MAVHFLRIHPENWQKDKFEALRAGIQDQKIIIQSKDKLKLYNEILFYTLNLFLSDVNIHILAYPCILGGHLSRQDNETKRGPGRDTSVFRRKHSDVEKRKKSLVFSRTISFRDEKKRQVQSEQDRGSSSTGSANKTLPPLTRET